MAFLSSCNRNATIFSIESTQNYGKFFKLFTKARATRSAYTSKPRTHHAGASSANAPATDATRGDRTRTSSASRGYGGNNVRTIRTKTRENGKRAGNVTACSYATATINRSNSSTDGDTTSTENKTLSQSRSNSRRRP